MYLETAATLISIATGTTSLVASATHLYKSVCGISKGDHMVSALQELQRLNSTIERLSEHILYAPNVYQVTDSTTRVQHSITDLRQVREYLEPAQRAIGGNILSSSMILTPEKTQQAMMADPWKILQDIRPVSLTTPHINPNMVAILFDFEGVTYIGWQMRGTLPMLFNLEHYSDLHVHQPVAILKPNLREPIVNGLEIDKAYEKR